MPTGLIVYNDGGQFQIDENYFSWAVDTYGSVYSGSTISTQGNMIIKRISQSAPADTVFAVYNPSGVAGINKMTYSGGVWQVDIAIAKEIGTGSISTNNGALWFALNRPKTQTGTKYGLEVYDASGNVRYNSFWKSKAPVATTPGVSANKFAFIGGQIEYTFITETEMQTINDYQIDRFWYMDGYTCTNGNITKSEVLYDFNSESRDYGVPGSTTDASGINQPMYAIDVKEFV